MAKSKLAILVVGPPRSGTSAVASGAEPTNIEVFTLNPEGVPSNDRQYDVGVTNPFGFRVIGENIYLSMGGRRRPRT